MNRKAKSVKRPSELRRGRRVVLHRLVRAWLATDPELTILGNRATVLFFGRSKPVVVKGYWQQAKSMGRWPIQNTMRQKPGELWRVTICPNAEIRDSRRGYTLKAPKAYERLMRENCTAGRLFSASNG